MGRPYLRNEKSMCFAEKIVSANQLDRKCFSHFVFSPGMLFGSMEKWWNSPGKRPGPHEGLDICFFSSVSGDILRLGSMAAVPCPFYARVVHLMDDFIGKTVILCPLNSKFADFYFFFAHLAPEAEVRVGSRLLPDTCFARIAVAGDSRNIPAHLHISVAAISELPAVEDLSWPRLNREAMSAFVDPMPFFTFPDYKVVTKHDALVKSRI